MKVLITYNTLEICCIPHSEKQLLGRYMALGYLANAYLLLFPIFKQEVLPNPPPQK